MTDASRDQDWMRHAICLSERGLGTTWPNPSVGCVIVKEGRLLGRGRTASGGRPHAETVALAQAGPQAKGATAYVTLEPCSHHGQTAPCTDALIAAGISRVVVAESDPNPKVDGLTKLRAAGIQVDHLPPKHEPLPGNAGFFSVLNRRRPFLSLKLALTIDGRIATASGESRWITNAASRRRVHLMRAQSDAILVGRATAEADDPMLDVRGLGLSRRPVRVVLDRQLSLPQHLRMFRTAAEQPTWIVHETNAKEMQRGDCRLIAATGLRSALEKLAEADLTRIFCEGGGTLAAALLSADLVDELLVFGAGKIIGADGRPGIGALGLRDLSAAPNLTLQALDRVDGDLLAVWRRGRPEANSDMA